MSLSSFLFPVGAWLRCMSSFERLQSVHTLVLCMGSTSVQSGFAGMPVQTRS